VAMTKDQIYAKAKRRYTEVSGICLQSLTELERINLRGAWGKRAKELPKDDPAAFSEHSAKSDSELLVCVIVDGEGGNRVFADTDAAELRENFDGGLFDALADAAWKHAFPEKGKAVEAAEKKSDDPADSK